MTTRHILLMSCLGAYCILCILPAGRLFVPLLLDLQDNTLWSQLAHNGAFSLAVKSSGMACVAVLTSSLIALPLGLCLGSGERSLRKRDLIYFIPLAIPPYLTAMCWQSILGRNGFLPNMAMFLFGFQLDYSWLSHAWGSGVILGLAYFPILLYLIVSGMQSISTHLEDSAKIIFPEWKVLLFIILPLLIPHFATGAILVFLLSLTNYSVPALLGFKTLTIKIYAHFSIFQDVSGAVILSLPLVLIGILCVVGIHQLTLGRSFFSPHSSKFGSSNISFLSSAWLHAFTKLIVTILIVIPIAFLIIKIQTVSTLYKGTAQSLSSIFLSVVLASVGSLCITAVAFFIAYASERMKLLNNWACKALLFLPFALPSVLLSIGLIQVWNRPGVEGIYRSFFILIFLWAAKYLPLAQRTIADQIRQIPLSLEEAAFMTHIPWLRVMLRIVWPITRPSFLLTWCIVYIFCLAELGGTLLIIPPGIDLMPIRLYNVMHYGSTGLMAAQGLLIVLIALFPLFAFLLLHKKYTFRKSTP